MTVATTPRFTPRERSPEMSNHQHDLDTLRIDAAEAAIEYRSSVFRNHNSPFDYLHPRDPIVVPQAVEDDLSNPFYVAPGLLKHLGVWRRQLSRAAATLCVPAS